MTDYDDTLLHVPRPADNVEKLREWAASLARDGHKPRITITMDEDSFRAYWHDSHRANRYQKSPAGVKSTTMEIPGGGTVELKREIVDLKERMDRIAPLLSTPLEE